MPPSELATTIGGKNGRYRKSGWANVGPTKKGNMYENGWLIVKKGLDR